MAVNEFVKSTLYSDFYPESTFASLDLQHKEANVFTIIKTSYTALIGVADKAEAKAAVAAVREAAVPVGNLRAAIGAIPRSTAYTAVRARRRACVWRFA